MYGATRIRHEPIEPCWLSAVTLFELAHVMWISTANKTAGSTFPMPARMGYRDIDGVAFSQCSVGAAGPITGSTCRSLPNSMISLSLSSLSFSVQTNCSFGPLSRGDVLLLSLEVYTLQCSVDFATEKRQAREAVLSRGNGGGGGGGGGGAIVGGYIVPFWIDRVKFSVVRIEWF